jgi:hypothetical protein
VYCSSSKVIESLLSLSHTICFISPLPLWQEATLSYDYAKPFSNTSKFLPMRCISWYMLLHLAWFMKHDTRLNGARILLKALSSKVQ